MPHLVSPSAVPLGRRLACWKQKAGEPPAQRHHEAIKRARTGVLTTLAIFVVLQLATAVYLENGPHRDPLYSVRLTRLLQQEPAAPEKPLTIVMLGSSRTDCALRSAELHELLTQSLGRPVSVGNFGLPGCGCITQRLTWNRLRHDGVRPNLVLIEVMPLMFNESWRGRDLTEERLPLSRVRYCDLEVIEESFSGQRPGLRQEWLIAWPNALYTQRLTLVGRVVPSLLPRNQRLWMDKLSEDEPVTSNLPPEDFRRRALEQARSDYADNLQHFHLGGQSCKCLRELLTHIRGDGVPAALVILPEGPVFQSWYAPGAYQQVREMIDELAVEFDVAVVDMHDGMAETDFLDSHHLTPASAAKFTERFGKEHLVPLLRQQLATTKPF